MSEEKYGFVYIWRDKKRKKNYIGCHWGFEHDGYICSSRRMTENYKRRPEDFRRKILFRVYSNKKDMFLIEQMYLKKAERSKDRYYNICFDATVHWASDPSKRKTTSQKLSEKSKALHQDPEYREKYLAGLKKRKKPKYTEESKERKRQKMISTMAEKFPVENRYNPMRKGSPEHSALLSENSKKAWAKKTEKERKEWSRRSSINNLGNTNRLGHTNTPEHRQKISDALKGRPLPEEHRKKLSIAKKGTKWSEERKAKHSETIKQMWKERKAS